MLETALPPFPARRNPAAAGVWFALVELAAERWGRQGVGLGRGCRHVRQRRYRTGDVALLSASPALLQLIFLSVLFQLVLSRASLNPDSAGAQAAKKLVSDQVKDIATPVLAVGAAGVGKAGEAVAGVAGGAVAAGSLVVGVGSRAVAGVGKVGGAGRPKHCLRSPKQRSPSDSITLATLACVQLETASPGYSCLVSRHRVSRL